MDLFTFSGKEVSTDADLESVFDTISSLGPSGWSFDPIGGVKGNGSLIAAGTSSIEFRIRPTSEAIINRVLRHVVWYKHLTGVPAAGNFIRYENQSAIAGNCEYEFNAAGQIVAKSSSIYNQTVKGTSIANVQDGNLHCIEFHLTSNNDSSGRQQVWVDGVLEINFQGNTSGLQSTSHTYFDHVIITGSIGGCEISHLKFWDDIPGGLVGDLGTATPYIHTHVVSAAGDVDSFTAHGETNGWECVDEVGMYDGDTTYIEGYNGDQILVQLDSLPGTAIAVLSTEIEIVARAEPGSLMDLEIQSKILGGSIVTATTKQINGNDHYKRYRGGVAGLTVANVNDIQVGAKLTAVP